MDPAGKRVLVTGASRGIGEVVARAFVGAGASVALVARNEAQLRALDPSDLEQTVRLDLTVPLELCRQAIPRMLRRGRGHLVNVSSLASVATVAGMSHYAATKAGLAQGASALVEAPRRMVELVLTGVPTRG